MLQMIENIGAWCTEKVRGLGQAGMLFYQVHYWMLTSRPNFKELASKMYTIGVLSLPVVLITGAFTGMVLAVQTYTQFHRFQVETTQGAVIGVAMVKELGPVLTALMLAGRVGSSIAAELGTMKVTEQIDALQAMGANPIKHLIVPRFLACVLLTPVLTVFSDAIGILGGYTVSIYAFHVESHFYWLHAAEWVIWWDILGGLFKAAVFGGGMALICCYKGFHATGGAAGVGKATTDANVTSCIMILISNLFLAILLRFAYQMLFE